MEINNYYYQSNQINKLDQINQTDQINQIHQINQFDKYIITDSTKINYYYQHNFVLKESIELLNIVVEMFTNLLYNLTLGNTKTKTNHHKQFKFGKIIPILDKTENINQIDQTNDYNSNSNTNSRINHDLHLKINLKNTQNQDPDNLTRPDNYTSEGLTEYYRRTSSADMVVNLVNDTMHVDQSSYYKKISNTKLLTYDENVNKQLCDKNYGWFCDSELIN